MALTRVEETGQCDDPKAGSRTCTSALSRRCLDHARNTLCRRRSWPSIRKVHRPPALVRYVFSEPRAEHKSERATHSRGLPVRAKVVRFRLLVHGPHPEGEDRPANGAAEQG